MASQVAFSTIITNHYCHAGQELSNAMLFIGADTVEYVLAVRTAGGEGVTVLDASLSMASLGAPYVAMMGCAVTV